MATFILIVTAVLTGLIAGLFYAFSCSINPGLGNLPDVDYLTAMQSINKAILNPVFFASFIGALVLLPLSTYLHYKQASSARFLFLLAATVLYAAAVFGVTIFGNVPLNESLARFDLQSASAAEITSQRIKFEEPWNKWNGLRMLASIVSLILVIMACLSESILSKNGSE